MNTKMGLMTKKEKQSPFDEKPTSSRPWPDLPPQLLHIVAKNSTLMNNISYGGYVTKSYRVPTRRCNPTGKSTFPQLVAKGIDQDRCDADTCSIPFHPEYVWSYGGRRRPKPGLLVHIVGCSHGLLVGRGRGYLPSSQCYLWDPVLVWRSYCNMPPWNTSIPFKHVAISSSLTYPNTPIVMVLTGINHPAFVFYFYRRRQGTHRWINQEYGWINQDCTLVDPYSSNQQFIQFTHAVGFKGKFYALSLQGTLAVIEESDSHLRITGLSTSRAVPNVPSKQFKEYLIESNGEILLVFLISKNSIHSVDNVEVYRLRFDRLSWVKMESLGDMTLFVGTNCCMSVKARKVGCRGNCIYFIHQAVDGWWVYDMDRGCISPGWNVIDSTTKFPVWDEPEEEEQLICKNR